MGDCRRPRFIIGMRLVCHLFRHQQEIVLIHKGLYSHPGRPGLIPATLVLLQLSASALAVECTHLIPHSGGTKIPPRLLELMKGIFPHLLSLSRENRVGQHVMALTFLCQRHALAHPLPRRGRGSLRGASGSSLGHGHAGSELCTLPGLLAHKSSDCSDST